MTDTPERIWARPVGAVRSWEDVTSGPWSLENPYGTSVEYVTAAALAAAQASIAELEADIGIPISELAQSLNEAETARAEALEEAAKAVLAPAHWDGCPNWMLSGIDAYRQRVVAAIRALRDGKP